MAYTNIEKETFIEKFKQKTKKFAIDVIHLCNNLPKNQACRTISFQLIKSATSVGANYRAACRGRSKAEFHSKISIVVEEADESQYWLEILKDGNLTNNKTEINRLLPEIEEIIKVVAKARKTSSNSK